jgi:hypothetical protein
MTRLVIAFVMIDLVCAAPSSAQTEHAYVQVSGLGTIAEPALSGEAGVRVWQRLAVFVNAGQLNEFKAKRLIETNPFVEYIMRALSPRVSMSVVTRGMYGTAGFRYELNVSRSPVRPYVLASAGIAQIRETARFNLQGGRDVTEQVVRFDLLGRDPSGVRLVPLAMAGAGVSLTLGWMRVDVGCRVSQLVGDAPPRRDVLPTVGLGVRF